MLRAWSMTHVCRSRSTTVANQLRTSSSVWTGDGISGIAARRDRNTTAATSSASAGVALLGIGASVVWSMATSCPTSPTRASCRRQSRNSTTAQPSYEDAHTSMPFWRGRLGPTTDVLCRRSGRAPAARTLSQSCAPSAEYVRGLVVHWNGFRVRFRRDDSDPMVVVMSRSASGFATGAARGPLSECGTRVVECHWRHWLTRDSCGLGSSVVAVYVGEQLVHVHPVGDDGRSGLLWRDGRRSRVPPRHANRSSRYACGSRTTEPPPPLGSQDRSPSPGSPSGGSGCSHAGRPMLRPGRCLSNGCSGGDVSHFGWRRAMCIRCGRDRGRSW